MTHEEWLRYCETTKLEYRESERQKLKKKYEETQHPVDWLEYCESTKPGYFDQNKREHHD